jgi:hypothetical protein
MLEPKYSSLSMILIIREESGEGNRLVSSALTKAMLSYRSTI